SSYAWQHYRENWVQLDPPRHIVIFSRDGLSKAAARAGLKLLRTVDDSTDLQFWGSEMYRRDIPLHKHDPGSIFSPSDMIGFARRANELNGQNQGDQAAFILSAGA